MRPSHLDAAREDRCLTRDQVILYTVGAGVPVRASGWSLLWNAGHTPPPRHLALGGRMPLWHVDDIDAYLTRDVEHWPLSQVADYLGYKGDAAQGSAQTALTLGPPGHQPCPPGRWSESRYAADQVQAAHGARPGRGRWAASRTARE